MYFFFKLKHSQLVKNSSFVSDMASKLDFVLEESSAHSLRSIKTHTTKEHN